MVRSTWYNEEPAGFFGMDSPRRSLATPVNIIIAINLVAFLLDGLLRKMDVGFTFSEYLGLDCSKIVTLWFPVLAFQLFTYQFLHAGIMHILINMLMLFFFGRELQNTLGTKRFLTLYLVSGIVGGLIQIVAALLMGAGDFPLVVGASGAIYGILIYYAMRWPNRTVNMFLFPIIVPMKVWVLACILVGISLFSGFLSEQADMVAHMCHLGGALFGFAYFRYESRMINLAESLKEHGERKAAEKILAQEKEVDRLLEKIHTEGINALTPSERKFLNEASRGLRKQ